MTGPAASSVHALKLSEVAARIGARLEGDGNVEITGVAGIDRAGPGQLTFFANPRYLEAAKTSRAAAIIAKDDFPAGGRAVLRAKDPHLAFAKAIDLFYRPPQYVPGVHPTAVVHATARIGHGAHIGAYVVVGEDVVIGENAVLLPHVVIYRGARIGKNFFAHAHAVVREFCTIGDDVLLQNGVVIGADGFGFVKDEQGAWRKIVQSGRTVIESNVEVQSLSAVDRATVGETRIARGAKLDNLVQIGHGSSVGADSMVCAQTGLAGSTDVGKNVILAGQVGVAGHCTIGDGVIITAQSGVHGDIPAGKMLSGSPAFDHKQWMRAVALFAKLPELIRSLRRGKKED